MDDRTNLSYRGIRVFTIWDHGKWQACAVGQGTFSGQHITLDAAMAELRNAIDDKLDRHRC